MVLASGSRLGRYEIESLVGSGGMGEVYLARDVELGRPAALKVLSPKLRESEHWRNRLAAEARAASALNHPNILTIYEIGSAEGLRYIASEYVDGATLAHKLAAGPLAMRDVVAIGTQASSALAAAHAGGIVHGDIKPANVMVRKDGLVKVVDFGIARMAGKDAPGAPGGEAAEEAGIVFGTLSYLAPEQLVGEAAGPASDVWSLGIVLYEMVCGHVPFRGSTEGRIVRRILKQALPPITPAVGTSVPLPLLRIIDRALHKEAAARYPSAQRLHQELSAIEDTQRRLAAESTDVIPAAVVAKARRRPSLPASLTPLVGRSEESAALEELLLRPGVRLVTLTGPGGAGKSRLAAHVAAGVEERFEGGVCFIGLASITDPSLVIPAIAHACDVKEPAGISLAEALARDIGSQELLLVADNFEQVTAAGPELVALLQACPRARLLVTSRAALRVRGEQEFPVGPLALPPAADDTDVAALASCPSVRLFVDRARGSRPDFDLGEDNARAVAEICRRLDGLPLAIELAAARVKLLPPAAMLAKLDRRLQVLAGGPRDLPARQQTMRAAIAWGEDLLLPEEKALFRRLATFVGEIDLAGAECLARVPTPLGLDTMEGVASLLDKSWLRPAAAGGEGCAMLETIREYGQERLAASGELAACQAAHAAFFLSRAEEAEGELRSRQPARWLDRMERDHGNLRAALVWYASRGDGVACLRLSAALFWFWYLHGHYAEGRRWLDQALGLAPEDPSPARARALLGAGTLSFLQCEYDRAGVLLQSCLDAALACGETRALAAALQVLGSVARERGDHAAAIARHEQSLARWREVGDGREVGRSENYIAFAAWLAGDFGRARLLAEATLPRMREIDDPEGTAWSLLNLAAAALYQGDLPRAHDLARECLDLSRKAGYKEGVAWSLDLLGAVARRRGQLAEAGASYREAFAVHRELGDRWRMASVAEGLAAVALGEGRPAHAARLLGGAERLRGEVGTPIPEAERGDWDETARRIDAYLGADRAAQERARGREAPLEALVAPALGTEPR